VGVGADHEWRRAMTDPTQVADLRERIQRAREKQAHHLDAAKASLRRQGYDVVPRSRKAGRLVGYVMLATLGAVSVAALIGAVGLAILATRWVLGLW
jgi:ElaB/YqjD/DUF883 family membrane-anchored ribosome-binding protein